jgi:hypothetical protein
VNGKEDQFLRPQSGNDMTRHDEKRQGRRDRVETKPRFAHSIGIRAELYKRHHACRIYARTRKRIRLGRPPYVMFTTVSTMDECMS